MCRHQEALSEEGVTSMIDGFDRQQIGGVQPRRTQTKGTAKQAISALVPDATSAEPSALQYIQEGIPHTHVQVCSLPCFSVDFTHTAFKELLNFTV